MERHLTRFWERVEKGDGCWEWMAGRNASGYGVFYVKRRNFPAHRFSWFIHFGEIPEGMFVCHHCDNPPCVNPEHLFLGTNTDNMRDMSRKGRGKYPIHYGEDHTRAKISDEDALVIAARRIGGEHGASLAREYGISESMVSLLYRGLRRKHQFTPAQGVC